MQFINKSRFSYNDYKIVSFHSRSKFSNYENASSIFNSGFAIYVTKNWF